MITGICILGVALGVAALVTVLSVTGGFQKEFRSKVLGMNAHVLIMKYGIDFYEYGEVIERARKVDGVVGSSPFIFHEMMLSAGTDLAGALVKGIDPSTVHQVSDLPSYISEGSIEALAQGPKGSVPGVIIGAELASKLKLKLGDPVNIVSPLRGLDPETWTPRTLRPTSATFQVRGLFSSGFFEYDSRLLYVHMEALQNFFGDGDTVTGVELKVEDIFQSRNVASRVRVQLGDQRYVVSDWTQEQPQLVGQLRQRVRGKRRILGSTLLLLAIALLLTARRLGRLSLGLAALAIALLAAQTFQDTPSRLWDSLSPQLNSYDDQLALTHMPHINVRREDGPFLGYRNAVQEAEYVGQTLGAGATISGSARIAKAGAESGDEAPLIQVRGVSMEQDVRDYGPWLVAGDSAGMVPPAIQVKSSPPPGALLDAELAKRIGLTVGDLMTLTRGPLQEGQDKLNMPLKRAMQFRVVGLLGADRPRDPGDGVIVDFRPARRMFSLLDAPAAVEVRLTDPMLAPDAASALRSQLGGHSYRTLDWKDINRNLFASLSMQKQVLALIVFAMVVVAMVNIISTLSIIVMEKSREIAILKSMGVTNGGIMRIFMVEGATIGTVGTVVGLGLGAGLCGLLSQIEFPLDPKIYLIAKLPVQLALDDFVWTGAVAVITSLVVAVIPSQKAAALPPAQGLRYDG